MAALSADIAFSCSAPQQGGVTRRVIGINYTDWLAATVTTDGSSNEITGITLAAGSVEGFQIQLPKSSNIALSSPLRQIDGVDGYDHTLTLLVNNIEQVNTEQFECARFDKVVFIVELQEGRSLVVGGWADATPEPKGVGLKVVAHENMPGDPATGGSQTITLQTPQDGPPEIHKPHVIDDSFDIDTLLTPTA